MCQLKKNDSDGRTMCMKRSPMRVYLSSQDSILDLSCTIRLSARLNKGYRKGGGGGGGGGNKHNEFTFLNPVLIPHSLFQLGKSRSRPLQARPTWSYIVTDSQYLST